jgi:chromosomal replication initiation ATPase DnaA
MANDEETTSISQSALNVLLSSPYLNEDQKVRMIALKDLIEQEFQRNDPISVNGKNFKQILDLPPIDNKLSVAGIIDYVASYFGIHYHDVVGKSRKANKVKARHIAMFLVVDTKIDKSYSDISKYFSTDHASISRCHKEVKINMDHDMALIDDLLNLVMQNSYVKV